MVTVNMGNHAYPSTPFTPTTAGTYRIRASYSGDANNLSKATACNDPVSTGTRVSGILRTGP